MPNIENPRKLFSYAYIDVHSIDKAIFITKEIKDIENTGKESRKMGKHHYFARRLIFLSEISSLGKYLSYLERKLIAFSSIKNCEVLRCDKMKTAAFYNS